MRNIRLCGIMYGHRCYQTGVSLRDSFGGGVLHTRDINTAGKPVKHVKESYSILDYGCLFTAFFFFFFLRKTNCTIKQGVPQISATL